MNRSVDGNGPDASHLGGTTRDDASPMECRICWYLYDLAEGDPLAAVPPGTGIEALPKEWCCPRCDSDRSYFLPVP
jgi:rubredoxin